MEKIHVSGIELAYTRRGSGTALVLLHGYPLDHHIWDVVAPQLERTFDLILPDLRGFGSSTTMETPYTLDDFASDIAGLLDHVGIQTAAIVGHSMGGYVALAFVNRYPQRVRGLGLVSSQTLADSPERKEGRYKTAQAVAEHGVQGVVETMAPKFTRDKQLQMTVSEVMRRQQPSAYIGALKAMAKRPDASALLTTLKVPVVVIHGEADELIPVDRAREVKSAISHAVLVELKGVGHLPMLESPRGTVEALMKLTEPVQ